MIVELLASPPALLVAAVHGELDMATGPQFRTRAVAAIDTHRPRMFVIDLAGVSFLDAAGVTALLATHRHAHDCGADFQLTNARPVVVQVLSILDLTEALHLAS